jgi:hypothetical protein
VPSNFNIQEYDDEELELMIFNNKIDFKNQFNRKEILKGVAKK